MGNPLRTLRGRIILASVAGLLAATGVFAVVSSSLVRSVSEDNARRQFDEETVRVAQLASIQIERRAEEGGCRSYGPNEFEAFVGPGARIYADALPPCPDLHTPLFPAAPPRLAAAIDDALILEQGFARIAPEAVPGDGSNVATAAPIMLRGQSLGDLIIVKPREEVRSAVSDVAPRLALAALIGLAPAVLLTLLLTARLIRPIREMRAATHRVAAGDMSGTVAHTGTADLDALVDDFNVMVTRLRQRDQQSRDFLMKVTHDLRTPLTAISGHTSALIDDIVPPPLRGRSLDAIQGEAARLERMVADLLDLARMEARQFSVTPRAVTPDEVVEHAVAAYAAGAADAGVRLVRHPGDGAAIETDPDRMGQIVANLIDNAVRWTPPDGRVVVESASAPGGGVAVTVSDSGLGIPADQREAVFAPFQSAETPDGRTGTGLGLAICRQLARALGGDVTVDEGPDGGARFTLTLPAHAPAQGGANVGSRTAPAP